jgi:hypothetical protein
MLAAALPPVEKFDYAAIVVNNSRLNVVFVLLVTDVHVLAFTLYF